MERKKEIERELRLLAQVIRKEISAQKTQERMLDRVRRVLTLMDEDEEKKKLIRVFTEGRIVTDVDNLPEGYGWKIIDYDIRDYDDSPNCSNCKNAEKCYVAFGDDGCSYEHYRHEEMMREKQEKQRREAKCKELLGTWQKKNLIDDIVTNMNEEQRKNFIRKNRVKG